MARELLGAGISRSSIHDAFSSVRLPQWHVVDALVEILASKAPGLTAEKQLAAIHALWLRAAEAEQHSVTSAAQTTMTEAEQHSVTPAAQTTMTEANRAILLLDIDRYSYRDDVEQAYLRRMLYEVADGVLTAAGINETQRRRADRGDSLMELIDASTSIKELLRALLTEMPQQLRAYNRLASSSAQVRLRGVLDMGHVAIDQHDGWVGSDLNHACRLLDAPFLRDALREHTNDFALCISESVYHGTVRHGHPVIRPERFHRMSFDGKHGQMTAWLAAPV
ncbi:hypothetical protein ACIP2Z_05730 [Streptomyces iakyrus]|uniref:Guanylate cyclase domain-containing protein n=1 Tax=Streptomyces iakyrus TaxID=68219 RepID=A0ABW8F8S2_9ACTN